jgi:hypothetical protein
VDEATLRLYLVSRSNANGLTLAVRQVLADWTDSQANRTQRQSGVNWQVAGLGAGSDYAADADGTAALTSAGGAWVELDVKAMAQAWVTEPATNYGLVLLAQTASGSVSAGFCSELGWSPCDLSQAPQLTLWYH